MQWFEHRCGTHTQSIMQLLISECGLEGYGAYWIIVEKITSQFGEKQQDGELMTKEFLTYPVKEWRSFLKFTPKKFEKLMKFLQKVKLFSLKFDGKNEEILTIEMPKLLKIADTYTKRVLRRFEQTSENVRNTVQNNTEKEKEGGYNILPACYASPPAESPPPVKINHSPPGAQKTSTWIAEWESICESEQDRAAVKSHKGQQAYFARRGAGRTFHELAGCRAEYLKAHKAAEKAGKNPTFAYGLARYFGDCMDEVPHADLLKCLATQKPNRYGPPPEPELTDEQKSQAEKNNHLRELQDFSTEMQGLRRLLDGARERKNEVVAKSLEKQMQVLVDKAHAFAQEKNLFESASATVMKIEAELKSAVNDAIKIKQGVAA